MAECKHLHLHDYLDRYGWHYHFDGKSWITGWDGAQRYFPLQISFSDTFILFDVLPLYDLGRAALLPYLRDAIYEWNRCMQLFRVVELKGSQLAITGQVFKEGFNFDLFCKTIGILGYYCDDIFAHLMTRLNCEIDDSA
jgi:hypothetical protein